NENPPPVPNPVPNPVPLPNPVPGDPKQGPPPTLVSVIPGSFGTKAHPAANLILHFSEPMDLYSMSVKTAANGGCTGSIQLSKDNFATCEPLIGPYYWGKTAITTVVVRPLLMMSPGRQYSIKVTTAVRNTSGVSMEEIQEFAFETEKAAPHGTIVQCDPGFARLAYLWEPKYSTVVCALRPTSIGAPVASKIRIHPLLMMADGQLRDGTYAGQDELILDYGVDGSSNRIFTIDPALIGPSFKDASIWSDYRSVRLVMAVQHSDGSQSSTYTDLALEYNVPPFDGPVYSLLVDLDVYSFQPGPGEMPMSRWQAWSVATYPGGREDRSLKHSLPLTGVAFPDLLYIVRDAAGPPETLSIHLDTTEDGVPDYTWTVPEFDVVAEPGLEIWISANGQRVNGKNVVVPAWIN
ncbi:MAG: Ig-like domain-containing protein, partial [Leptospiraceae bacterium]|nr:Ig-like domain-containing protein [Leptospiraceae bacterium]